MEDPALAQSGLDLHPDALPVHLPAPHAIDVHRFRSTGTALQADPRSRHRDGVRRTARLGGASFAALTSARHVPTTKAAPQVEEPIVGTFTTTTKTVHAGDRNVGAALALAPVYVGPSGVDSATCGTGSAGACASLKQAVQVANAQQPRSVTASIVVEAGSYGPKSCGANATRPLNITGAGSSVTRVDCGGLDRALYTNDSLVFSGLTLSNGSVAYNFISSDDASFGGGGIAVVWSEMFNNASATFMDVVWISNSVAAMEDLNSGTSAQAGGAAVVDSGYRVAATLPLFVCSSAPLRQMPLPSTTTA